VQKRTFSKGEVIFREGDESSEAYRITSGEVEISIDTREGSRTLARLTRGEFFGEMGLIDDKPRSATAAAVADTEVEVITEENFTERVLGDSSNLEDYLRTLLDRLRATDALLQWHLNRDSLPGQAKSSVDAVLHQTADQRSSPAVPPVADAAPRLRLTSVPGGPNAVDVAVAKIPFRLGRVTRGGHGFSPLSPNDLSIPDEKPHHVSRNHCVIERSGSNFVVRDLGSRIGTIVNGTPLGIEFDGFVAPLKPGENSLILGSQEGPHHFKLEVL
jgi:hypothetical protein